MLIPTPPRILVARDPVDFRKGIAGLAAVCEVQLGEAPLDGPLFVFTNRLGGHPKPVTRAGFCPVEASAGRMNAWRMGRVCQALLPRTRMMFPFLWLRGLSGRVRPKSKLGEAVRYGLNQEAAMRVYLSNGELPMHNNLSELMLRQAVVGRKNWLFAGSEGGAKAAATLYTLVGSCMLQGVEPWVHLSDVLSRIGEHPISQVSALTPRVWRLEREGHRQVAG